MFFSLVIMTVKTKEILAELGVLGTPLPRSLVIPVVAAETDLLNIQMVVMTMLTEDTEIAEIVSNQWTLGVEIRAYNVKSRVWDLLDLEDKLDVPDGATIQVNIIDNEPRPRLKQTSSSTSQAQVKEDPSINVGKLKMFERMSSGCYGGGENMNSLSTSTPVFSPPPGRSLMPRNNPLTKKLSSASVNSSASSIFFCSSF